MNFLCSDCGKALVPDWEFILQHLNASVKLKNKDLETETNIEKEQEEWMLLSELNLQAIGRNNEEGHVLVPEGFWHNTCEHFEENELNSMTSWLNNKKTINDPQ